MAHLHDSGYKYLFSHAELVQELLEKHYDPLYHQSQHLSYQGVRLHAPLAVDDLSASGMESLARRILQQYA